MANENVIFRRGPSASIPEQKVPGTVLIETDTGNAFVDDTTTSRVQLTDTRKQDDLGLSKGLYSSNLWIGPLNSSHVLGFYSGGIDNIDAGSNIQITNGTAGNRKIIYTSEVHDFCDGYLKNVASPTDNHDAANKQYVDIAFTTLETELGTTLSGYLPLKGGTMTGDISMGGSKITATYTPSTNNDLTNKEYVDTSISEAIAASDAMVFKGTIGTSGTVTQLPTSGYRTGWTYRVVTAGTYAGKTCEIGDMLIALNDGPGSGSTVIDADWADVQANISGAVITPNNLTANQLIVGNNGQSEVKTLAAGSNGQFLSISSGTPSWTTLSLSTLGVTTTVAELNYMDGVTSNVQTQLDAKSPTNHASSATTYGVATTTNYGHVRVTTGGLALSSGVLSHATGAGYTHLPSGGSATQVLIGTSTSGQGQWTNTIPPEVIIDDGVVS